MKSVLIVEDLPEAQELLREVALGAFPGAVVQCASHIREAMQLLSCGGFSLALVDLSLPDGDGLQVVSHLAERSPHTVVVVATIFGDDAHLFPALRAGAQGYLLKDQTADKLIAQLRGIQEGHPPMSPAIARRMLAHFRGKAAGGDAKDPASDPLTPREREVLILLAGGMSIAQIGTQLGISPHTAGEHVKNIYSKLKISTRAEAALKARKLGLV